MTLCLCPWDFISLDSICRCGQWELLSSAMHAVSHEGKELCKIHRAKQNSLFLGKFSPTWHWINLSFFFFSKLVLCYHPANNMSLLNLDFMIATLFSVLFRLLSLEQTFIWYLLCLGTVLDTCRAGTAVLVKVSEPKEKKALVHSVFCSL